jgi:hypothetical protein
MEHNGVKRQVSVPDPLHVVHFLCEHGLVPTARHWAQDDSIPVLGEVSVLVPCPCPLSWQ